jgi:tetratricopeptide (TPR) repeat protein
MTIPVLVRKILVGAAESSLDVAGTALLPGAWPILKGALGPVLDRLKERLGGQDVTSSKELARKAADAFEADQHLQEVVRSALVAQLDNLVQQQRDINADVQRLMIIVSDNQETLAEILGGVEGIDDHLTAGVNLSDDAVAKLAEELSRQAESSREVRAIALRAMGPVADLLERQVQRLQIRAVELVQEGAPDRARDELDEGMQLVAVLLNEAPTDVTARLGLGFIYKTAAQVATDTGEKAQAAEYIKKAEEIFRYINGSALPPGEATWANATAINGLGNLKQETGDLEGAVRLYRDALRLVPNHPFALHDLISAYYELAKQGQRHPAEMRQALAALQQAGVSGMPGLSAQHMADLEYWVEEVERGGPGEPANDS